MLKVLTEIRQRGFDNYCFGVLENKFWKFVAIELSQNRLHSQNYAVKIVKMSLLILIRSLISNVFLQIFCL